jgi:NTP pyrophosphatase (non-canonical NTP hydrolase)
VELSEAIASARELRELYASLEAKRHGRSWTVEELALGLVGDVGDLAKLVQAASGVRDIPDWRPRLAHELADCLWSVLVLADQLGIDIERAFDETMSQLKQYVRAQVAV